MEYGRLKPLKGVSGQEPTAFTKKTIKELLAEEGAEASEALLTRTPEPQAGTPEPPQQGRGGAQAPAAAQPRRAALMADEPAEKPRSFLRRLIGR